MHPLMHSYLFHFVVADGFVCLVTTLSIYCLLLIVHRRARTLDTKTEFLVRGNLHHGNKHLSESDSDSVAAGATVARTRSYLHPKLNPASKGLAGLPERLPAAPRLVTLYPRLNTLDPSSIPGLTNTNTHLTLVWLSSSSGDPLYSRGFRRPCGGVGSFPGSDQTRAQGRFDWHRSAE